MRRYFLGGGILFLRLVLGKGAWRQARIPCIGVPFGQLLYDMVWPSVASLKWPSSKSIGIDTEKYQIVVHRF